MNSQIKNKFHIHTLGCKVNQYESQAMRELLVKAGFEEAVGRDLADVYIVNTCTVTGEADRESKNITGKLHRVNPAARIVLTGCLAEDSAAELSALPGVSAVLKNSDKNRIAEVLAGTESQSICSDRAELSVSGFKGHSRAYVKIQDGCENRCSYCKVPIVRGVLSSKPIDSILSEVKGLIRNGFNEIVLTGICLGAWGKDLVMNRSLHGGALLKLNLIDVLKALVGLSGDFRLRLSSIEPKYVTDELIDFIATNEKICTHLHIPFQSGDDDILRLMNRPYSAAKYMSIANKVRAGIPGAAITTDILIGFPGESQERFDSTMNFMRLVAPSRTHIFTFSRRAGTPAFDMIDAVSPAAQRERYRKMSLLAAASSDAYRASFLGSTLKILVETERDPETGRLKGYSENYIQVEFDGPDSLMRRIIPVKISSVDKEKSVGVYG